MSYLNVPRINFGGLFFTNPDTTNNIIQNYDPQVPLSNSQGAYLKSAGWNAVGVAQLWLAECTVLSAAGPTGALMTEAATDPIIGAAVESPSPSTPKRTPDGKGYYDIAKMVDLDPDMQGRSAVFGLRIYVTLPGGAGFSGLVSVPELQFLNQRTQALPNIGSWSAVGTWMGQIAEVTWSEDAASSPFLAQFKAACRRGIAVKLTMDLHQNSPQTKFTPGNMFCYGRVHGSLGPIGAGELAQVVPGRQVAVPPAAQGENLMAAAAPRPLGVSQSLGRTIDERFRGKALPGAAVADAVMAVSPAAPAPWNPAPAQVGSATSTPLLHLDLGGSIWVESAVQSAGVGISDGKLVVDSGIVVGVQAADGSFQPLANGAVSFASQYTLLNSQSKQVNLVCSAGIVDIPLQPDEVSVVGSSPLIIQVTGTTVLQEPADGLLLGSEPLAVRLEPGGSAALQLMARRFGQPIVGQQPVTWQIFDSTGAPSTGISIAWAGATGSDGIAVLNVSTASGDVALPDRRKPLDSQLYIAMLLDSTGQPIGDGSFNAGSFNVNVLRFQSYTAPPSPTWQADVGPVLEAYARLYPGMKDKLDIGDEATVQGAAPALFGRMSLPLVEPAYMPVTRDLSPAKIRMILQWLKGYLAAGKIPS
jgi:hypothetical protein